MKPLKPPRLTQADIRAALASGTKNAAALELQLREVFSLNAATAGLVLR